MLKILVQVVLVDDASNHTEITNLLPSYIKSRLPSKVTVYLLFAPHIADGNHKIKTIAAVISIYFIEDKVISIYLFM